MICTHSAVGESLLGIILCSVFDISAGDTSLSFTQDIDRIRHGGLDIHPSFLLGVAANVLRFFRGGKFLILV